MTDFAITDRKEFSGLWLSGKTLKEIAEVYGVTHPTVCKTAARFGLQPRRQLTGIKRGDPKKAPARDEAEAPKCPKVSSGPSFDRAMDEEIFATAGRYAELSDLAWRWGLSIGAVVGRWHRLRVAR